MNGEVSPTKRNGIEVIAVLRDPVRRRLYGYVVAQDHEVSRNEAAESTGVQRTLAAFHLDRLVEAGLLETTSRRLTGRSGPGAGRPAKLYKRAAAEHAVSLPARDYRTAAELLAEAAEAAGLDREIQKAARRHGRTLAGGAPSATAATGAAEPPGPPAPAGMPQPPEPAGPPEPVRAAGAPGAVVPPGTPGPLRRAAGLLAARGYEPATEPPPGGSAGAAGAAGCGAVLRMRNCPFHALAERFPPLVCGMNLALLEGLLEAVDGVGVRMDPRPGMCCAVVHLSKNSED